MRRLICTVLLLLLVEVFWLRISANGWSSSGQWRRTATRISVGFPLLAVSFTTHSSSGSAPLWGASYPEYNDWQPGLKVFPFFLIVDALMAVAVFYGISRLLQRRSARIVFLGVAIGAALGLLINLGTLQPTGVFWYDEVTWFNGVVVFIALPAVVCIATYRDQSWHQPVLLLAVAVLTGPWGVLWCDQFKPQFHPFVNGIPKWAGITGRAIREPSIGDMLIEPLAAGIVIAASILLTRRFLPFVRRHQAVG